MYSLIQLRPESWKAWRLESSELKARREPQINIIRCSDMNNRQIESLSEETQALVKDIVEKGLLELEEFRHQKEKIKRLYHSLNLAIIASKDETDRQLKQVRKGKKVVEVYRSNF